MYIYHLLKMASAKTCVNLTRFLDKDSNNDNSKVCLDFWIPGDIMLMEIVSYRDICSMLCSSRHFPL